MKKLLSLLLATVMVFGLLAVTAYAADVEMPPECAVEDAGVKVTCTGNSEIYTFETLTQDLFKWMCATLPGSKTVEILKDLTLSNEGYTGATFLAVPTALADWIGGKGPGKDTLTIDLGGHKLTYAGSSNLFTVNRWGFTLKNGEIDYTCTDNTRSIICLGTTTGQTAVGNSSVWEPQVVLDNITAINRTEKSGSVIISSEYAPRITLKNSNLWSTGGIALYFLKTTQEKQQTHYEGPYDPQISVLKSTVGSLKNYPVGAVDTLKLTVGDTALVSGKDGKLYKDTAPVELTSKSAEEKRDDDWTGSVLDTAVSGAAMIFGTAPGDEPLPFTDVKDSDWFYSFVKQMYTKKVISGMTATTFVPNGTLTYGQALKLLVAAIDTDVGNASSGHWASNYLAKAKEKGWVDGDVDLDGKITRLAFCQIAAKAKGLTEQPASNPFTDTADTSVLALVNKGVINGMSENTFAPDNTLTRAQIAKIIALLTAL